MSLLITIVVLHGGAIFRNKCFRKLFCQKVTQQLHLTNKVYIIRQGERRTGLQILGNEDTGVSISKQLMEFNRRGGGRDPVGDQVVQFEDFFPAVL